MTVDDYLNALPVERRSVVEELRRTIRAAAPDATETISYQMPALRIDGRFLVSYAAVKRHYKPVLGQRRPRRRPRRGPRR